MKNFIVGLIVVFAAIAVLGGFLIASLANNPVDDNMNSNSANNLEDNSNTGGDVVTFKLTGENYKFLMDGVEAPELHVKKGDTVRIELTSTDGFHDWVVDEFDAATSRVSTGESASVEFIADKSGTFEYYCSVGRHREFGMKGNLVVE